MSARPASNSDSTCFPPDGARAATAIADSPAPGTDELNVKKAVGAYVNLYPLVTIGVSMEVLTNVEYRTWKRVSAPVNEFMSVRDVDRRPKWTTMLPRQAPNRDQTIRQSC